MGNTNASGGRDEESLSDVLRATVEGQYLESPASGKVAGTVSSRSSLGGSGHSQDSASDDHKPSQSCSSQGNDAGRDASRIERRGRGRHTSGSNGSGDGGGGSGGGGSSGDGRDSAKGHVEIENGLRARKINCTSKAEGSAAKEFRVRRGVATRGSSGDNHAVAAEGGKKRQASKDDNNRNASTGGDATKAGNVPTGRMSMIVAPAPLKVMIDTG